jgi:hypothetical protein
MAAAASTIPTEQQLPSDALYIFTDLETESIQANTLLQIAAVSITGEQFNTFINPQCPLTEDCSNLLGLFYFNGDLYRDGRRLFSKNIKTALLDFMLWLSNFNKPIVLVFHNGFSFDCKVLSKFLVQFNILVPQNLTFVADSQGGMSSPEVCPQQEAVGSKPLHPFSCYPGRSFIPPVCMELYVEKVRIREHVKHTI